MTDTREALVVGGGPAGAALGILLARRRREVTIIEKTGSMQDKVCGEFLSGEAVRYLAQLGLDIRRLGAIPVYGVSLAGRKRIAECELPFAAMAVTRRALDEALLAMAVRGGVEVRRGVRVETLQRGQSGWNAPVCGRSAPVTDGDAIHARSVFLATGKHDIGGWQRPKGKQNNLIAFKMYFALAAAQQQALRGWIELCLFPGGYAGLQLTEGSKANLCLLVSRAALRSCGNDWRMLLAQILRFSEHLAERLDGAHPLLEKPMALSSIPYGMLLRNAEPGLWRLGDQAAVTPSFSGDGMSIALHSAAVAAELYLAGGTSRQLAARLTRELRSPIALATNISRLMIATPALAELLRAWPPLLSGFAGQTRVPQAALMD
jgi:flavin-dependent dehydrogenase